MCWKRRQPHNSEDVTQDCEAFVKEHYFSNLGKEANKKLRKKRILLPDIFTKFYDKSIIDQEENMDMEYW